MNSLLSSSVAASSIASHLYVLCLLALRRSQYSPYKIPTSRKPTSTTLIRCIAIFSAICTLALPYAGVPSDPLFQSALRVSCFYFAAKISDLAIRCSSPPTLIHDEATQYSTENPAPLQILADRIKYVWLLATEMRFSSFDIAVKQKGRPEYISHNPFNDIWAWLPPVIILVLFQTFRTPETKALLLLVLIVGGLDALHAVVHRKRASCTQPLFWKPFTAASFAEFWTTKWQGAAAPFLQSLGYKPAKRVAGQWLGVLAAFNITGIWHAWASVPIVEPEGKPILAFKVWTMFMMWGVGILLERVVWGKNQGGLLQRIFVWTISVLTAAWCIRSVECHSTINLLRTDRCGSSGGRKYMGF